MKSGPPLAKVYGYPLILPIVVIDLTAEEKGYILIMSSLFLYVL